MTLIEACPCQRPTDRLGWSVQLDFASTGWYQRRGAKVGFILTPNVGGTEAEMYVNAWNWRCTLEILRRADLLDEETLERAGLWTDQQIDGLRCIDRGTLDR
jgi:hypothetical protein